MIEEDKYRSELLGVWNVSYGLDKLAKTLDWWPSGIVITDHRGVIVYANPSFLSMTGYKKLAEVVNKNIPAITDDAGAKMLGENCILVLGSEKKWGGKLSIKRVDGSLFDASVLCSYLPGPAGNAGNMLMDVHYLPHAGDAIESLSIYDRSRTGIAFYDHSGRLIGANKRCLEFFGVANESEISEFSLFKELNYPEKNIKELADTGFTSFETDYDYEFVKEKKGYKMRNSRKARFSVSITFLGSGLHGGTGYIIHLKETDIGKHI
jgi:PAS domain S-box-containing protein